MFRTAVVRSTYDLRAGRFRPGGNSGPPDAIFASPRPSKSNLEIFAARSSCETMGKADFGSRGIAIGKTVARRGKDPALALGLCVSPGLRKAMASSHLSKLITTIDKGEHW
jgi:hypothetical protein